MLQKLIKNKIAGNAAWIIVCKGIQAVLGLVITMLTARLYGPADYGAISYLGGDQLASWSADEAEIEEYATCKDWTVEYTFMGAGEYYLWYKASKDGETEEVPYAPDPVKVEEAGEEEPVYSDFRYVLNEEGTGVVITAYLGSAANVEVPETIEEVPVTEIGADAFLNNATLTRITLPQTV